MPNIPGTSGPVDYPNRPEGGIEDGPLSQTTTGPLPGGTNRYPQPAPANMPTPAMGAGVPGSGGLTPNPGEPADGTVQKGYKGSSYSSGGAGATQSPANTGSEFVTGGQNGSSAGVLGVPTTFSEPSTPEG